MKILVVEDSLEIIDAVSHTIALRWPDASFISTTMGETGIEMVRREQPDVVILDLGLPDITGFQVLHEIRSFSDVPLILLTVRGDEIDKIKGLEMGADDYIVKPFSPGELLARIGTVLRRRQISRQRFYSDDKTFIRGQLRVDFVSREVSIGDRPLKLSPSQYEILHQLIASENKSVSRQELLEKLEDPAQKTNLEYFNYCIQKLKETLESELGHMVIIVEDDGNSYKFVG
ncbi:MAG: response regulator transcription factor [Chloroflexi bacterium]|nr:response regulator transcription factor [Chloroflexota bacterium]